MPLPVPETDENRERFIARCLIDDEMLEEFPERPQRLAVCIEQWRERES